MPTAHETVLQAARTWIAEIRGWTDIEAADLVIPADRGPDKGPRPAVPFLVVELRLFGQQVGTDEKAYRAAGKYTQGTRAGLLSIHGFGLETSDWLEEIAMHADQAHDPLSIIPAGRIIDLSELAGTHIEARYMRDFEIAYAVVDGPRAFVEAVEVVVDVDHDPDDPSISVPVTVDWS